MLGRIGFKKLPFEVRKICKDRGYQSINSLNLVFFCLFETRPCWYVESNLVCKTNAMDQVGKERWEVPNYAGLEPEPRIVLKIS